MSLLKDFILRSKARKSRMSDYEDGERIAHTIDERKKSHNERVLAELLEEERQLNIKEALDWEKKKRAMQDKLKARQMMKFNPEFFNKDVVLNQKNIFLRGGNF